ncbi:MAG: hypothetical protein SNJ77_02290 [Cytophagales bacterium]
MRKLALSLVTLFLIASCGEKNEKKTSTLVLGDNIDNKESEPMKVSNKAVLLWNSGIIDSPSKDGKWLATYQFGNQLTLTGNEKTVDDEKKTYLEVVGPDGKTGWLNTYLVEKMRWLPFVFLTSPYIKILM